MVILIGHHLGLECIRDAHLCVHTNEQSVGWWLHLSIIQYLQFTIAFPSFHFSFKMNPIWRIPLTPFWNPPRRGLKRGVTLSSPHLIYPLTARVVGTPRMISQPFPPFFSILHCPQGHCALQDGFGQTWWTGDMPIPLQFASLYNGRKVFVWSDCLQSALD